MSLNIISYWELTCWSGDSSFLWACLLGLSTQMRRLTHSSSLKMRWNLSTKKRAAACLKKMRYEWFTSRWKVLITKNRCGSMLWDIMSWLNGPRFNSGTHIVGTEESVFRGIIVIQKILTSWIGPVLESMVSVLNLVTSLDMDPYSALKGERSIQIIASFMSPIRPTTLLPVMFF